ncbi:hypothetical protein GCM10022267_03320 [Lentzea roselyniae]|uniref:DUF3592 domain-containing protein n=1 Tax=Lentzea roselyniae TaxID=531940 RepID=A0ABP6ZV25_9PSEU
MLELWYKNRLVRWAGTIVGLLLMVFGGPALVRSVKIAGGHGIPGYYQVTGEPDCSGVTSNCFSPDGTFTSDDRTVTRTSVQARLPKPVSRGDLYRTYDVGDDDEVYVKTNKGWHIAWPYWVFLTGLFLFGLGVQHFWQNWRSRKRQEPDAT